MDKSKPKTLLDQVRDTLRVKHYAYRTVDATPKIWRKLKSNPS